MSALSLFFYNLLAAPVLAAAALPALMLGRWREGLGERLGTSFPEAPAGSARPVWIHGASVGEVLAAQGLLRRLLESYPDAAFVFSTFTASGRRTARERFAAYGARVTVTLAPLDWAFFPARALKHFDPALFVILETELWPNLIYALQRRRCPLILVNGRLSERSFPRYRRMKWFFSPLLGVFSLVCARTSVDAERFRRLGVEEGKVRLTGNMKYDFEFAGARPSWVDRWPGGREGGRQRLVAGSLRGKEDALVLRSFAELRKRFASLQLILAPRYPERFDAALLEETGLSWKRWSEVRELGDDGRTAVVLVDTLGDLAALYAAGDVAFVGGTLEGTEGQNMLEPAAHGVPVLFGPGYGNFREEAEELLRAGGGFVTAGEGELTAAAELLLGNEDARADAGRRAREVGRRLGGATERTLKAIGDVMENAP